MPTLNAGTTSLSCAPTTSARFLKARASAPWNRKRSRPSSPSSKKISATTAPVRATTQIRVVELNDCRVSFSRHAHLPNIDLRIPVTRTEFESWIKDDLEAIERSVDSLLQSSGVDARDVDRVFLTGGTAFVPAVRRIFAMRFGDDRIRSGNEFTSVASGLALRAAEVLNENR